MTFSGMTFLTPTIGIIAAAIATPLIVLLYFLKLRRRPVRISSILLWSQAVQDLQVNEPFRWIRFSWLLILQLLALACLCVALARPVAGVAGNDGARVILLIDHSASMSAQDAADPDSSTPLTRLNAAKRQARDLIDRLVGPARAEAMIVSFAGSSATRTAFTRDRGLLKNAINDIEPTDQPADFDAALRVIAGQIASAEGEKAAPPRVVVLSDGDLHPTPGAASGVGRATFDLVSVGPAPQARRNNVGIVVLSARRDFEDPGVVRVFARLQSTLDQPESVVLRCNVDADTVASTALTLPAADTTLGVAGVSHTFEIQNTIGGMIVVSIMRGDALSSDNSAAMRLAPAGAPVILLVRTEPASTASEFALLDALAALEPKELRVRTAEQFARSATESLAGVDLIVFDRVRPERLPPIASLSFGATVPIAGLGVSDDPDAESTGFAYWLRSHPVMRSVSLGSVRVDQPLHMTLPADRQTPDAAPPVTVQTLASGTSGPMIAAVEQGAIRRVVVGFTLAHTNWWRSDSFPVFIANAVEYITLRGEQDAGAWSSTTEAVLVRGSAGTTLRAVGPRNTERSALVTSDGVANLGVLPLAGVYTIEGSSITPTIAVNLLDANESAIRTARTLNIAGEAIDSSSPTTIAPREVWQWFVLAALVLLTLDWLLFGWRSRV